MFDLEKSIAEWRKQMLAAGIKTPVPLEELESHLREDILGKIKSGANVQRAFEAAVQQIGQPDALKKEFKKAPGIMKINHISRRFSSGMLVVSGAASLVTLWTRFVTLPSRGAATLASYFKAAKPPSLLDLYMEFAIRRNYADFASECLVLSLILTALFALLRFRLSKWSRELRNV